MFRVNPTTPIHRTMPLKAARFQGEQESACAASLLQPMGLLYAQSPPHAVELMIGAIGDQPYDTASLVEALVQNASDDPNKLNALAASLEFVTESGKSLRADIKLPLAQALQPYAHLLEPEPAQVLQRFLSGQQGS